MHNPSRNFYHHGLSLAAKIRVIFPETTQCPKACHATDHNPYAYLKKESILQPALVFEMVGLAEVIVDRLHAQRHRSAGQRIQFANVNLIFLYVKLMEQRQGRSESPLK